MLDVLHGILDLAFAFRICGTTEDRLERTALHIALKDCRHPVVTDVLVIKEDRILIIYDMARHTMEVFESLLMGQ